MKVRDDVDWANVEMIPMFPCTPPCPEADAVPAELIGATIVAVGQPPRSCILLSHLLMIDFIPASGGEARRIVLEFDDRGMEACYLGDRSQPSGEPTNEYLHSIGLIGGTVEMERQVDASLAEIEITNCTVHNLPGSVSGID
jgi:hypothetical protein